MKRMKQRLKIACLTMFVYGAFRCCLTAAAGAQSADYRHFDMRPYRAMVDAGSAETIAAGTQISLANWTKYRRFMPIWMQALYSGQFAYRVPNSADYSINVGPGGPLPFPPDYTKDTEKYAGQARLVSLPDGGFSVEGYIAGLPFPNPESDLKNAGIKVLYDSYFHYNAAVMTDLYNEDLVDKYGNASHNWSREVNSRTGHRSVTGFPINDPLAPDFFFTLNYTVLEPEQSRYTQQLQMYHTNTTLPQEIYVFLPSLRRSLRLSSSARCSPLLGSDWTADDSRDGFSGIPNMFKVDYIGKKKLVSIFHADPIAISKRDSLTKDPALPGWPTPRVGKFELRDTYVLDLTALPKYKPYCYGDKIFYVDAETFLGVGNDFYDPSGKFWKALYLSYRNQDINDGHGTLYPVDSDPVATIWDVQNNHTSIAYPGTAAAEVNKAPWTNTALWCTPSGLASNLR